MWDPILERAWSGVGSGEHVVRLRPEGVWPGAGGGPRGVVCGPGDRRGAGLLTSEDEINTGGRSENCGAGAAAR